MSIGDIEDLGFDQSPSESASGSVLLEVAYGLKVELEDLKATAMELVKTLWTIPNATFTPSSNLLLSVGGGPSGNSRTRAEHPPTRCSIPEMSEDSQGLAIEPLGTPVSSRNVASATNTHDVKRTNPPRPLDLNLNDEDATDFIRQPTAKHIRREHSSSEGLSTPLDISTS